MQQRLSILGVLLLGLWACACCDGASAQSWPAKPIHVVVPFTAGSATDIIARTVFEQVGRQIGQPAVIESRLGAGGTTASAAVARSDPDKALQAPDVRERIVKLGGEPTTMSPAEFDAHLRTELETNAFVVRASGLKAN